MNEAPARPATSSRESRTAFRRSLHRLVCCTAVLPSLVSIVACLDPVAVSPENDVARSMVLAKSSLQPRSTDDALLALAARIPGFAGLWRDEARLHVALTDARDSLQASSVLKANTQEWGTVDALVFHDAEFTFTELYEWRNRLLRVPNLPGIVYLDADERQNRVVIGVASSSEVGALRSAVALFMPGEALAIRVVPGVELLSTLRDSLRPVEGGAVVVLDRNQTGWWCTIGFNVSMPEDTTWHALTNSHCGDFGAFDVANPTKMHQNVVWGQGTMIATEVADPPYQSGAWDCPSGRKCRYSETALYRYTSNVLSAGFQVYRTTSVVLRAKWMDRLPSMR